MIDSDIQEVQKKSRRQTTNSKTPAGGNETQKQDCYVAQRAKDTAQAQGATERT